MTTYTVPCDLSGEMNLEGFGVVAFEIAAGQFVPATAQLEAVCARLAAIGQITVAAPKPAKSTKPAQADEPEE
jgi:hypothetical protein